MHAAAVLLSAALGAIIAAAPAHADAAAGKAKAGQCQTCHGMDGMSQIPNAPHIAGQPEMYLAEQLNAYRTGTRQNEMMSVVAQGLSEEDVADLAAYYAAIEVSATVPDALK